MKYEYVSEMKLTFYKKMGWKDLEVRKKYYTPQKIRYGFLALAVLSLLLLSGCSSIKYVGVTKGVTIVGSTSGSFTYEKNGDETTVIPNSESLCSSKLSEVRQTYTNAVLPDIGVYGDLLRYDVKNSNPKNDCYYIV